MFKKIVSVALLGVFLSGQCFALEDIRQKSRIGGLARSTRAPGVFGKHNATKTERLASYGGLTFYKNYSLLPLGEVTAAQLAADYAIGSKTATFTRSLDATHPATYITDRGIINLCSSSNTGRIGEVGFSSLGLVSLKGLVMERASTNLIYDSYFLDGTTTYWGSGGTAAVSTERTSPLIGGSVMKSVTTAVQSNALITNNPYRPAVTSGVTYTVSCLIRGSGTFHIYFQRCATTASDTFTLADTDWQLFQFPYLCNLTGTSQVILVADTDCTMYVAHMQCEPLAYASSIIPTTAANLTRNSELLSYLNSGNSTQAGESIFIKYVPCSDFLVDGVIRFLHDTDTDRRLIFKEASVTTSPFFQPTDNTGTCTARSTTAILANTSYVQAMTMSATGNPNLTVYTNGVSEAVDNDDYTALAWGNNFYPGNSAVAQGDNALDGIIQEIVKFNRVLTPTEVAAVSDILKE